MTDHLAEERWFTVSAFGERVLIKERRAVFYREQVRWDDHPWGESKPLGGRDFSNEWSLECRRSGNEQFWASGRTPEPLFGPGETPIRTYAEALEKARKILADRESYLRSRAKVARASRLSLPDHWSDEEGEADD